jgi:hypothetical protein
MRQKDWWTATMFRRFNLSSLTALFYLTPRVKVPDVGVSNAEAENASFTWSDDSVMFKSPVFLQGSKS